MMVVVYGRLMSTFTDRANTALLVIDVQCGVVANAHERDSTIANINALVDQARATQTQVIWVQHADDDMPTGTDGWQLAPELVPLANESIVHKNHRDSFEATTLEAELERGGISRLVVTGAQTDFCVRWTLHGALTRGYDTVLVGDAHTTDDMSEHGLPAAQELIAHTNLFWQGQGAPDRATEVANTADVSFS